MSYWVMGIGAALAVAGTAANSYGTAKQNRKAQRTLDNALIASKADTDKSADELMQTIAGYQTDPRQQTQSDLEEQTFQRIVSPVNESQINRATEQGTTGDVSKDYEEAKGTADARNLTDLIADARRKAAVVSAQRLRQDEAYKLGDVAAAINQRTRNNNANLKIANLQAQNIANRQNGLQTGGQIASLLGQAMMMYGAGSALAGAGAGAGTAASSGASGYGLTMPTSTTGYGLTSAGTAGAGLGAGKDIGGMLLSGMGSAKTATPISGGLVGMALSKDPFYFTHNS